MKSIYKEQLFEKNILVAEDSRDTEDGLETIFSLVAMFNIRIIKGAELAQPEMIRFSADQLGMHVPEPFYRYFPQSVRSLAADKDKLFLDQCFHYLRTYGLNQWNEAGHSMFEDAVSRTDYRGDAVEREFSIVNEEEAVEMIKEIVDNLMCSSRPLNDKQYALVKESIEDYGFVPEHCTSKNTAVRLLSDTRRLDLCRFIALSDVIKLVDEINYRSYDNENIKKLNLRNQDRKFITSVINHIVCSGKCDIKTCSEKKALWCGLLHHIHYSPINKESEEFVHCMRSKGNVSIYSDFEKAMADNDIKKAVSILRDGKGSSAVLRNLVYILSRCKSEEEVRCVVDSIDTNNVIILLQLLLTFSNKDVHGAIGRTFKFPIHNKLTVHHETIEEIAKRRSIIAPEPTERIADSLKVKLRKTLSGRLGKVYIDPDMRKIALPLQENTSQGGVGVLPKGSRLPIKQGKKLRAFTYWELVNDIDLSIIGIDEKGNQTEFSWRTMYRNQSDAITYSGDETSGYNGGSEFFDIDLEAFKELYPTIKYLVLCDNVFSDKTFDECFCKAGYMIREREESGEIFEPKTVASSFLINCSSRFAYLFGIDLHSNEFVWLNVARDSNQNVAGATEFSFLTPYFNITSVINMYSFFEMMATELTDEPSEADYIVSDKNGSYPETTTVIRSCDFDKILALMNR